MSYSDVLLTCFRGPTMIEIRKVSGNSGYHIIGIPPRYIRAMGLNYGDYMELYMVDKLTLVIRKHNTKAPYGIKRAAESPPIDV